MVILLDNGAPDSPEPDAGRAQSFVLGIWSFDETQLSRQSALEAGFSVADITAGNESRVLVREFRNYSEVSVGRTTEYWGVSIRLVVSVQATKLEGGLNLPVVTAKAQLNQLTATANLVVRGFSDPAIGAKFPDFHDLNVETYSKYTKAMDDIRKYIVQNDTKIEPLRLAVVRDEDAMTSQQQKAVAESSVLHAVAQGRSLEEYLAEIDNGPGFRERLHAAWSRFDDASASSVEPSDEARERAREILEKIYA